MEKILETVNTLRTDPKGVKPKIVTVSKAMRRIKKVAAADELDKFAKEIDDLEPVPALKFSEGLSLFCEQQLDFMIKEKKENMFKPFEELKKEATKYVKGFNKLYLSYDKGGVDFLVARMIVSEYDPQKQNKRNYLSPEYGYIGISTKEFEDDDVTVVIFADYVEDIEQLDFNKFKELKKAYDCFDVTKEESVNIKDLKSALRQLNYDIENPTLWEIIDGLENEETVKYGVSFPTFCIGFYNGLKDRRSKTGLSKLFRLFVDDQFADGINEVSLKKLCKYLDIQLKDGEAREIIERASESGREVTFDEFYTIMISSTYSAVTGNLKKK